MLKIDGAGIDSLAKALNPLLARARDPRPGLDFVGQLGARAGRRNIDRQQSPEGVPYPKTARGGTILRDRNTLYGGITYAVTTRGVTIGAGAASSAYNAYQHFGSELWQEGKVWAKGPKKDKRKGNPPRNFIGISQEDADEMIEEVADFFQGVA
jgi:phage gpG-like protein